MHGRILTFWVALHLCPLLKYSHAQSIQSVYLGFTDCSSTEQATLKAAWDDALSIATAVPDPIPWHHEAETDFLGSAYLNIDSQSSIQNVLNQVKTYRQGWLMPWVVNLLCSDRLQNCENGVTAYTIKDPTAKSPTAVFCPKFFEVQTCGRAIEAYGSSPTLASRLLLNNYVCQGSVVLHEMMHFPWTYQKGTQGQIVDLYMEYKQQGSSGIKTAKIYGPMYTKVLGAWTNSRVGLNVNRNADNLALYALAKYVTSKINEYPMLPRSGFNMLGDPWKQSQIWTLEDGMPMMINDTAYVDALGSTYEDVPPPCDPTDSITAYCVNATNVITIDNVGERWAGSNDVAYYDPINYWNLDPFCNVEDDNMLVFNRDQAYGYADGICNEPIGMVGPGLTDMTPAQSHVFPIYEEFGYWLIMSATFDQAGCDPALDPMPNSVEMASISYSDCMLAWMTTIDGCGMFVNPWNSTTDPTNTEGWKTGGTFYQNCIRWETVGLKNVTFS